MVRKIIVFEHISLDGVIQGPGGREEDPSDGFTQGGWIAGYSDPVSGESLQEQMSSDFDLLLGRRTYDIWTAYWPLHADQWPQADRATKYVASNTLSNGTWQPTEILNGDLVEKVKALKRQQGKNLHIWGSSNLLQTLLRHDLVDVFWLMIYPITLGSGKKLFADGTIGEKFALQECKANTKGVIFASYERKRQ